MTRQERRALFRLLTAGALLVFALACGQQSCDCAAPLERPLPENARLYDSVQARLTPAAFDFIEQNLPGIIATFLEGGLTFEVPPSRQEFDLWLVTIVIDICPNGCTLTAEIVDANITPTGTNTLALDAHINLSGVIQLRNDLNCDVDLQIRNKPVHADINLLRDDIDHFLFFNVSNPQVTLSNGDYDIDCSSWFLEQIINLLKSIITGQINNAISDQLGGALNDAVREATCLTCDFYTAGCPSGSVCQGGYCQQGGACRKAPLGMAGAVDLSEQLADLGGSANPLLIMLAAGQWAATSIDPVVVAGGLELRLIGAADAVRHACVPEPEPSEIPPNVPPERLVFSDVVPDTSDGFMAGIGLSDAMLDWFLYKAHLTGLLCLGLGTQTTDMLTSSTLSLMGLKSLNTLTTRRNNPVWIKFRPTRVPYAEIGAGTFATDEQGNRVIDQPLLYIFVPGMELDFWVRIDERWTRVVTIGMDLEMDLSLDFDAQNRLVPLFGEESIKIANIRVLNYELLGDDPAALEQLLPSLIGMALPMLTGAIEPIEIPPMEGFVLDILAIKGVKPRDGTPYFDYLGLFANLRFEPANPAPPPVETRARLVAVYQIPQEISLPGRLAGQARAVVELEGESGYEYSARVDGGGWRLFQSGPRLQIRDPILRWPGPHLIEVRARAVGDYRTLDPTPQVLWVEVRP